MKQVITEDKEGRVCVRFEGEPREWVVQCHSHFKSHSFKEGKKEFFKLRKQYLRLPPMDGEFYRVLGRQGQKDIVRWVEDDKDCGYFSFHGEWEEYFVVSCESACRE